MGEHTRLPWQISPVRTTEDTAMIVGGEGFEFGLTADVTEDQDAAFIVKTVNNHDDLVEMLKEASLQIEYLQEKLPSPTSTGVAVLARINHLLSRVGGSR